MLLCLDSGAVLTAGVCCGKPEIMAERSAQTTAENATEASVLRSTRWWSCAFTVWSSERWAVTLVEPFTYLSSTRFLAQ